MAPQKAPSKSRAGPPSPQKQYLSKDIIESSDEDDNGGMEVDQRLDDNGSVDSHEDLEAVTPRRKERDEAGSGHRKAISKLQKYEPPPGMVPVQVDISLDESPFEYTQLEQNPRLQLWAIRVPADLKPSRLAALNVAPPKKSQHPKGSLTTKHHSYELRPTEGGGDEMTGGMRLMVPHAGENGRFFPSPIPISQHLMLVPNAADLDVNSLNAESTEMDLDPPAKRKQPTHLFKFRNQAYGYSTPGASVTQVEEQKEVRDVSMSPKTTKKDKKAKGEDRPAKKSRASKTT